MKAYGFVIAAWMHWVSVAPRIFFDVALEQSVRSLTSRFGPTVPVAPAAASVWHPLQPAGPRKTAFPADAPPLAVEGEPEAAAELEGELEAAPAEPGTAGWLDLGGGVPIGGGAPAFSVASQCWKTAGWTTYT